MMLKCDSSLQLKQDVFICESTVVDKENLLPSHLIHTELINNATKTEDNDEDELIEIEVDSTLETEVPDGGKGNTEKNSQSQAEGNGMSSIAASLNSKFANIKIGLDTF